jgi:hypothetical protein
MRRVFNQPKADKTVQSVKSVPKKYEMEDKPQKAYLWICGASASGKGILLNKIRDKGKDIFLGRWPINGDVSFVDLSFRHGMSELLSAEGNTVIIKMQRNGIHLMEDMRRERPESAHRVIYLKTPLARHIGFFHNKYADSRWLKDRLGIARPLTRIESARECIRDRKTSRNWLRQECLFDYDIINPLSIN